MMKTKAPPIPEKVSSPSYQAYRLEETESHVQYFEEGPFEKNEEDIFETSDEQETIVEPTPEVITEEKTEDLESNKPKKEPAPSAQEKENFSPPKVPKHPEIPFSASREKPLPPEQVDIASIEKLDTTGSSGEQVSNFAKSSPSAIAQNVEALGPAVNEKLTTEQKEELVPVPKAQVPGEEKLEKKPFAAPKMETEVSLASEQAASPTSLPEPVQETPAPVEEEKEDAPGLWESLFNLALDALLSKIKVKAPEVDTTAGQAPELPLDGAADPALATQDAEEGTKQVQENQQVLTESLHEHPGQENIQPLAVEESVEPVLKTKTPELVQQQASEEMQQFAKMQLPAAVREQADSALSTVLAQTMKAPQEEVEQAQTARETAKQQVLDDAEKENQKLNEQASKEQQNIVSEQRKKVETEQQSSAKESQDMLDSFHKESSEKAQGFDKEIKEEVEDKQKEADLALKKGEEDAQKEKQIAEKDAATKRQEVEKKGEDEGPWGKVGAFFESAKEGFGKLIEKAVAVIDTIFTALRNAVKSIINKAKNLALSIISNAQKWVVGKLNDLRDWTKKKAASILKNHPALLKKFNDTVDGYVDAAINKVNEVAEGLKKNVTELADSIANKIDEVLDKFQTGITASLKIMGAVLSGDFEGALRIAIEAACEIAGIDPSMVMGLMEKAGENLMLIFSDPGQFFSNLVESFSGGVKNFKGNILTHLKTGVVGWLVGTLSGAGLSLPETWDIKGIFSLSLQILNISYQTIKTRVIKLFPPSEKAFDFIENNLEIITDFLTRGPIALWDYAKEKLTNLKETVFSAIKGFIQTKLVQEGIKLLLSLLSPASAIVRLVMMIYDFAMFLYRRIEQIVDFVKGVYDAVSSIAAGKIGFAIQAVEGALTKAIAPILGMLAALLNLNGISKTITETIGKIRKPIDAAITKVVKIIVDRIKAMPRLGKKVVKKVKDKVLSWWEIRKEFPGADGKEHAIYFKGKGEKAELMVASDPTPLDQVIEDLITDEGDKEKAKGIATKINSDKKELSNENKKKKKDKDKKKMSSLNTEVDSSFIDLVKIIRKHIGLTGNTPLPQQEVFLDFRSAKGAVLGKKMLAKPLVKGEEGSKPTLDPHGVYDVIDMRRAARGSKNPYYIRGHMLNQQLGGLGIWENMVPLSREGNRIHEAKVESKVKAAVKAGAIVEYSVDVMEYHKPTVLSENELGYLLKNGFHYRTKDIRKIKEYEQYIPKKIKCEAYYLEVKGGGKIEKKEGVKLVPQIVIENPISQKPISEYFVSGTKLSKRLIVNAGKLPMAALMKFRVKEDEEKFRKGEKKVIMTEDLASKISKATKSRMIFSNWKDFANKIDGYESSALVDQFTKWSGSKKWRLNPEKE